MDLAGQCNGKNGLRLHLLTGLTHRKGHTADLPLLTSYLPLSFYAAFSGGSPCPYERVHKLSGYKHAYSYRVYTKGIPGISLTFVNSYPQKRSSGSFSISSISLFIFFVGLRFGYLFHLPLALPL